MRYQEVHEPENPFSLLVKGQTIVEIPQVQLESGETLHNVPVAFKTWGKLNKEGTNCMVICHALTGSSDVVDWWGPLLGKGKAFDPSKFFIVCLNSLGSPYGSCSPVTRDPAVNELYGPEFPLVSVRDDVNIHRLILNDLGVKQVTIVIGGSMGGMLALEWCFFGLSYVLNCVVLATSAKHSAWCISWGEAQRQSIYSDPKYDDGYYPLEDPPIQGLGAARMSALLTYRSRNSFEERFGRGAPTPQMREKSLRTSVITDAIEAPAVSEDNCAVHNDGHYSYSSSTKVRSRSLSSNNFSLLDVKEDTSSIVNQHGVGQRTRRRPQHYFSAQSYLRYQAAKFSQRFDANCYISITRKLDTHDVGRNRPEFHNSTIEALQSLEQNFLVVGIQSDALFTYSEQVFIAKHVKNSKLCKIDSPEGHDAFLLEFEAINKLILEFEIEHVPELLMQTSDDSWSDSELGNTKESIFGEVEDPTSW